jgi:hypothetical protein
VQRELVFGCNTTAVICQKGYGSKTHIRRDGEKVHMKIQKNSLMLTAAFTGLLAGTMTRLNAASAALSDSNTTVYSARPLASQFAAKDDKKADKKADKEKNSCGGKGGCGSESPKKDKKK